MPNPIPEKADTVAELDPDLQPEEHAYVNHYVNYADILLKESHEEPASVPEFGNVIEMPQKQAAEPNGRDEDGKAA